MVLQKPKKSLSKNKLGIMPSTLNKGEPIRRKHKALVVILIAMVITIATISVVKMVKTQQTNQNKLENLIKENINDQQLQLKKQNESTQNQQQKLQEQIEELKKQVKIKKESKIAQAAKATLQAATPKAQASSVTGTKADWMTQAGIPEGLWGCVDALVTRESGWRVNAQNPTSPAYGLPQSLPGSKMASAGADWQTNPVTQLRWMTGYVNARYGGYCQANAFQASHNWY